MVPEIRTSAKSESGTGPVTLARTNGGHSSSASPAKKAGTCPPWTLQYKKIASATAMPKTKLSDMTITNRPSTLLDCEFTLDYPSIGV